MANGFGLYIHIPFCSVKCGYCNFYVRPGNRVRQHHDYTQAIIGQLAHTLATKTPISKSVTSIYFGGGTPSLLPVSMLSDILHAIGKSFTINRTCEITLEANPEDVNQKQARAWRAAGFNRVSLGVQSLSNQQLQAMGRIHNADMARGAYFELRSAMFDNINIDLIFGQPQQGIQQWLHELQTVVSWYPEHISTYDLTIEKGTAFGYLADRGRYQPLQDHSKLQQYFSGRDFLTQSGYRHDEVSNFARPGQESRHNHLYWDGNDYWGLGVSAHSFQWLGSHGQRWHVLPKQKHFLKQLYDTLIFCEQIDPISHWQERLLTGLRMIRGINIEKLSAQLSVENEMSCAREKISQLCAAGYMAENQGFMSLTDKGLAIADTIILEIAACIQS